MQLPPAPLHLCAKPARLKEVVKMSPAGGRVESGEIRRVAATPRPTPCHPPHTFSTPLCVASVGQIQCQALASLWVQYQYPRAPLPLQRRGSPAMRPPLLPLPLHRRGPASTRWWASRRSSSCTPARSPISCWVDASGVRRRTRPSRPCKPWPRASRRFSHRRLQHRYVWNLL